MRSSENGADTLRENASDQTNFRAGSVNDSYLSADSVEKSSSKLHAAFKVAVTAVGWRDVIFRAVATDRIQALRTKAF